MDHPEEAPRIRLAPAPIGRMALAVEISNRLRQMIFEDQLQAGEKINERLLTEQFGVSRTPLREALKVLANEGLLELIPHRGAVITRQGPAEMAEVFHVLATLEGLAGELAAKNASEQALCDISGMTGHLRRACDQSDQPAYFRIEQEIQRAILKATGNQTLMKTHELLASRVQRARYRPNLTPDRWRQAIEEQEAITHALCARKANKTSRLMKEHLLTRFVSIRTKTEA